MASQGWLADLESLRSALNSVTALIQTFQRAIDVSYQLHHETRSPSVGTTASSNASKHPMPDSRHTSTAVTLSSAGPSKSSSVVSDGGFPSSTASVPADVAPQTTDSHPTTIDPLALLSDASKLLSAQVTKLSLLVINDPFSPKEIAFILNTLSNSCLPALASSLELLAPELKTNFLQTYIRRGLERLWTELLELIQEIPSDEDAVRSLHRKYADRRSSHGERKGTLASTGVIWDQCEKLGMLRTVDGVRQVFGQEVKDNMDLIADSIVELEAWDPNDDSDDDPSQEDSDVELEAGIRRNIIRTPTTSDEEEGCLPAEMERKLNINPLVAKKAKVLKHIKLVRMLCEALNKRRIVSFPPFATATFTRQPNPVMTEHATTQSIEKLDALIEHTKFFTAEADEIAGALYEDDVDAVERRLQTLRDRATACAALVRLSWRGETDVFTAWSDKWILRIGEIAAS